MSQAVVDKYIDEIDALPSAPRILPKLLSVLGDPDSDLSRVVDLIAYDPGLTAKVLRLCNSAWLGTGTPATDIGEAVNRLGIKCVFRLVAAVNGSNALRPSRPMKGLEADVLWKHSVVTALAAQFLAQDQRLDESVAFTSALLHDAGKIVLARAFKYNYEQLLAGEGTRGEALVEKEKARFSICHAEAGGRLLKRWQFPEAMIGGVAWHHQPSEGKDFRAVAACVCLADALAHFMDNPANQPCAEGSASAGALAILGLKPDAVVHYRDRTLENFEFVDAMCRL